MRVKFHLDNNKTSLHAEHRICIQLMDGTVLRRVREVKLKGEWIIRQYNNPTPCGEVTVIYAKDESATYEVIL